MSATATVTQLDEIEHALLVAARLARSFSDSAMGQRLTPAQSLAVQTLAAFDEARLQGLTAREGAAKLRELADTLEGL